MTAQFWYGLLAFPALLIILGAAVAIPYGALWLLDKAHKWRLRKLNEIEVYESTLFDKTYNYIEDPDDRLLYACIMATAENIRFRETPIGVFFYSNKRYDAKTAKRLEYLLRKAVLRDHEERTDAGQT